MTEAASVAEYSLDGAGEAIMRSPRRRASGCFPKDKDKDMAELTLEEERLDSK
jgi:hypothetical protein